MRHRTLAHGPDGKLRRFEVLLFIPWAWGTLYIASAVLGTRLFLLYLYGWNMVSSEHLRVLAMPKGKDWPLSNGDVITHGFFMHYLLSLACWLLLFSCTYPLIRLLLPARRPVA